MRKLNSIIAAATLVAGLATFASAQETKPVTTTAAATTTAATTTTTTAATEINAEATREEFRQLLERHPPQVGRVLKLDPTLFANSAYLATYPAIAAFIAQHPEVAHTPSWFLESVWLGDMRPETPSERVWGNAVEGFAIFMVIGLVATILSWIIRTLIQHRRWSRVSKVQAEVHNKLMDRFASNEELLAYISTPAGQRFLETAPLKIDAAQESAGSPAGRILWSIQAGLVVAAAGVGLWLVSFNTKNEVSQPLFALGVLAISVGAGFIVSAVVSLAVSRKLGLWTPPAEAAAND
jgi:hypothetical protein